MGWPYCIRATLARFADPQAGDGVAVDAADEGVIPNQQFGAVVVDGGGEVDGVGGFQVVLNAELPCHRCDVSVNIGNISIGQPENFGAGR